MSLHNVWGRGQKPRDKVHFFWHGRSLCPFPHTDVKYATTEWDLSHPETCKICKRRYEEIFAKGLRPIVEESK